MSDHTREPPVHRARAQAADTTAQISESAGARKPHSIEDLMQLRAHIDQELDQRLTQQLCLMLADVVGSTSFFQQHGDVQGRLFVQRHHDTLTPVISEHRGRVIKTIGDAVMAAFEHPKDAVDCAIAIQRTLWQANQQSSDRKSLQTKISLHYGTALVEDQDIYGDLVNMSARLNSLVEADQVLISHDVYEPIKGDATLTVLPLKAVQWREGEQGFAVYEVVWRQPDDASALPTAFREFSGSYHACFYCGLHEHAVTVCPSKQLSRNARRLQRLGYLPLTQVLKRFQQQDLNILGEEEARGQDAFEAFYEISLPYQLRFLIRVWLATDDDWNALERQQTAQTSALAGSHLWMGYDCLRVGRFDEAKKYFLTARDASPGDYRPHVGLGFWAMESDSSHAALQHWRHALSMTKTGLQTAYLHLLIHRLYALNGKTAQAQLELKKAMRRSLHLPEVQYRQLALTVKEDKADQILGKLEKLIRNDRTVYLKVLLDPAFTSLRDQLSQLLTKLLQEARDASLEHMRRITTELNSLRPWYRQPEKELQQIDQAIGVMREHIKAESYFGYCDALQEGENIPQRIDTTLARHKDHLRNEFTATLDKIKQRLSLISTTSRRSGKGKIADRLTTLHAEAARLQKLQVLRSANQFWDAWMELQTLKAEVESLHPDSSWHGLVPPGARSVLGSCLTFGSIGSLVVDNGLVGIIGYLSYFSGQQIPVDQLLVILGLGALGGFVCGNILGWAVRWYNNP